MNRSSLVMPLLALAIGASVLASPLAASAGKKTESCTNTTGYWGTHSKYGPSERDPAWDAVGEDTPFFLSGKTYYQTIVTKARNRPYYMLAINFIGAALNVAHGSLMPDAILAAFLEAEALFQVYTPAYDFDTDPDGVRSRFLDLEYELRIYNHGRVEGSCPA
jgi:hypothetical protein